MTDLDALEGKLDKLLEAHVFDAVEVMEIKRSIEFARAFGFDPATLYKVQTAWLKASGFVWVTTRFSVVLMFVVVLWSNWDRFWGMVHDAITTHQQP